MRRVKDRERKYLSRKTKAGRLKRRLEYCAAAKKRFPLPSAKPGFSGPGLELAGGQARTAVGGYGQDDEVRVPLPRSQGVTGHDSQTGVELRPRALPTDWRMVVD